MTINQCIKHMISAATLLMAPQVEAQAEHCKDSITHHKLQEAMWAACKQDDPNVVYSACWAFQSHAKDDNDLQAYYDAWICGIMYNLDWHKDNVNYWRGKSTLSLPIKLKTIQ